MKKAVPDQEDSLFLFQKFFKTVQLLQTDKKQPV